MGIPENNSKNIPIIAKILMIMVFAQSFSGGKATTALARKQNGLGFARKGEVEGQNSMGVWGSGEAPSLASK